MSTYYNLRCRACREQGGHFTRQAWGWGNADTIENTVFLMAHADCSYEPEDYDDFQETISIVSEYNRSYDDEEEVLNWINNLQNIESRANGAFPHDNVWDEIRKGADVKTWWGQQKEAMTERKLRIEERLAEEASERQRKRELRDYLIAESKIDVEAIANECIANGGHYFDDEAPIFKGHLCATCGTTKNGALIQ